MSEAASSGVAALVTSELLADAAAAGMTVSEDAAQQIAERVAVSDPEPAAPQPVQEADTNDDPDAEFEMPNFQPVDLEDLDDDDDTPVVQPAAAADEDDDDDEFGYDDDEKRELRKQLREFKAKAEYAEKLRLQEAQRKWRSKMENQYPLANWDAITGTSRRSFEKAAAQSHNANYEVLKPHIEKLDAAWKQLKGEAKEEAKREVQQAWGKPTVGPTASTVGVAASADELAEARASGSLEKVLRVKRKLMAQQ